MRYRMATVRGAMLTGAFLAAMSGCSRFQKHREQPGVIVEKPVEAPVARILDFSKKPKAEEKPAVAALPSPVPPRSNKPEDAASQPTTTAGSPLFPEVKKPTPPLVPTPAAPRVVMEKREYLPIVTPEKTTPPTITVASPPKVERLPVAPLSVGSPVSAISPVAPLSKETPVTGISAPVPILPPEPPGKPTPPVTPSSRTTTDSSMKLGPAYLPASKTLAPTPSAPTPVKATPVPEASSSAPTLIPAAQIFPDVQPPTPATTSASATQAARQVMPVSSVAPLPEPAPVNPQRMPVLKDSQLDYPGAALIPKPIMPLPEPAAVNATVALQMVPPPLQAPPPSVEVPPMLPPPGTPLPAAAPSVKTLPVIPVPPVDPTLPALAARPEADPKPVVKPLPVPPPSTDVLKPSTPKAVEVPKPQDVPLPSGNKFDISSDTPPLPKPMPLPGAVPPVAKPPATTPKAPAATLPKAPVPIVTTPVPLKPAPAAPTPAPVATDPTPLPSPEVSVPLEGNVPTGPLTLTDAVSLAHRLQPRLRVFLESVIQAEGEEKVAHAPFLPTAAVGVSAGGFDLNVGGKGSPAGAPGSSYNFLPNAGALPVGLNMSSGYELAEVRVQWLVTDFGRRLGRYRQAQLGVDVASLQTDRAFQTVAHEVVASYYSLLRTRALRTTVEDAAKRAESDLEVLKRLQKAGEVDRAKVLAAEVRLSQVRRTLDALEAAMGTSLSAFNLAIGLNVNCPTEIVSETHVPAFHMSLADCLQEAVCHRRELEVAQRSIQMAQEGRNVAKADFRPRVIADGSLYNFQQGGPRGHADVAVGAIKLEWGLFEGGRRIGELRIADSKVRAAAAQAEAMADTIAFQVSDAYRQLIAARRGIDRARPALDKARETYKLTFDKLKQGDASTTDVTDAENALAQAEQDLLNSSFDYLISLSSLQFAMGQPVIPGK